jgi:hypothetical protein
MQTLAKSIAHRYPAAWRNRYETEVLSLIDAGSIRLRDVVDLLRGCIRERVLSLYEPSRHISAYRLISGLALTAFISILLIGAVAASAVPFLVGYLIQLAIGPISESILDAVGWALLPLFAGLASWSFIQLFRLRSASIASHAPASAVLSRFRWILIGCFAVVAVLNGMSTVHVSDAAYNDLLMPSVLLLQLWEPQDGIRWPGSDLFETLGRLRVVRYDLRWAQMELDRCEGIYAGREPGPELRAARAEMERLSAAEADTLASLDAMGYHARFAA